MQAKPAPFCKWAGGKGQLLECLRERQPEYYRSYFEPFVGGGAILFGLQPKRAYINDINEQLIGAYCAVQNSCEELIAYIDELDAGLSNNPKAYYYDIRERYNHRLQQRQNDIQTAAMFIFLNKHCFNGLYRVNSKGLFNVPYNNSTKASYNTANLQAVSNYLQCVTISCDDFESVCKLAQEGDFVFFDSPYVPLKDTSFEAYTKEGFSKEDHERLAMVFSELSNRGCYCMLTNHNTEFVRQLYWDYHIETVSVKRMINSDASGRAGEEVIIRNYV